MGKNRNTKRGKLFHSELETKQTTTSTLQGLIKFKCDLVDEEELKKTVGCPWVLLDGFIKKCFHDFASMTWEEIDCSKKQHHYVSTDSMSKYYRDRLSSLIDEGILQSEFPEKLFGFRLEGKQRIYGLREKALFHIIWFDPHHAVVPSQKKHT